MTKIDLREYAAVLLDLDGTIWSEDVPLPGALELIAALSARRQPFAFISNSDLSTARLVRRFAAMGVAVDPATLFTAARAASDYVRATFGRGARVYSCAGEAPREQLGGDVAFLDDDDRGPCDVVMTSSLAQPDATLPRLQRAMRHLLDGAALVAACGDRRYPTPHGPEIGSGGVAAMLAHAANVTPTLCGKPFPVFFTALCDTLRVDPKRCVLVGDNPEADIAGARPLGMRTILPLTGITTREHLSKLDAAHTPDVVIDDLRSLV